MSKALSANIHDPNYTVEEYDIYFNGYIISGSGDHELSANIYDPNHTADAYDIYFNGELIESGGKGWTDGVPYTDIEIVKNEYVNYADGTFIKYSGWNRTGYVPCNTASSITFPAYDTETDASSGYNAFYNINHEYVSSFSFRSNKTTVVPVPSTAAYFIISATAGGLDIIINNGITPNA